MDKMLKIALVLTAYDKISQVVNAAVDKSSKKLSKFEHLSHNFNEFAERAMIGGEIATEFFHKSIEAAEQHEAAATRMNTVFRHSIRNYKEISEGSEKYANQLQMQIGVENDVIMGVQAKLGIFKRVTTEANMANGVFNRATKAAFDMQADGLGDASSAIVKIGKILDNPIKSINSLSRAGIVFSKVEQEKIKKLIESKKLHEVQDLVLRKIESRVGGVAAKTATSGAKMQVAFSELNKEIGKALLPTFEKLAHWVMRVVPIVQKFIEKHKSLIKWVAIVTASLFAVATVSKVLGFAISGVASAFRVLGGALKFVGQAVLWVGRVMMANPILLVIAAIAIAAFLIYKYWDKIKAFFIKLWANIKRIFFAAVNAVKTFLLNFTPEGLIFKNWDKISAWFSRLWSNVKKVFTASINWLKNLGKHFFDAGANIMKSIYKGMKAFAMAPYNAVKNMVKKIRNLLPFSPAKEGPLKDIHKIKLIETIAASINSAPMIKAMKSVVGDVSNYGSKPSAIASASAGGGIHLTYAPTINGSDNNGLSAILKQHAQDVMKLVEEGIRKKERTRF